MTLIRHEWRQGRASFAVWTGSISVLLAVCVFLFPEMKGEMEGVGDMFASMGSFTAAFGMDKLNFGTLLGYYAIECGNVLGLGGAFYAALTGITSLAKEEKDGTAEYLLTHPVSRAQIVTGKLAAVALELLLLNAIVFVVSLGSMAAIGEEIPLKAILLLHAAYLIMQIELAGLCFGISAFIRRGGLGIGLGLAMVMYCLNLIANITERMRFLKWITPFGYCDGAQVVTDLALEGGMIALGMAMTVAAIVAAYVHYSKKDIR